MNCSGLSRTASNTRACRRGSAQERDDEVWAVVAFLQRLPQIDADQYREMAGLELGEDEIPVRALAQRRAGGNRAGGLFAMPWPGWSGARQRRISRLDIQTAEYLFTQLQAYAAGTRQSGIMQPVAAELDATDMRRLADYFAAQRPARGNFDPRRRDQRLGSAAAGHGWNAGLGIPPCLSCHGGGPGFAQSTLPRAGRPIRQLHVPAACALQIGQAPRHAGGGNHVRHRRAPDGGTDRRRLDLSRRIAPPGGQQDDRLMEAQHSVLFPGGTDAETIATLSWIMFGGATAIFLGVLAIAIWRLSRQRNHAAAHCQRQVHILGRRDISGCHGDRAARLRADADRRPGMRPSGLMRCALRYRRTMVVAGALSRFRRSERKQ